MKANSLGASTLTYGAIVCFSIAIVLMIDAWIGNRFVPAGKWARIRHPVYHHTLAPNVVAEDYWGKWYTLCTDGNGFKSDCHTTARKHFDLGIIGDSFTEGMGLPYEQTFVGMIAKSHPEMTVANLGVVSYSPSIYLAKVRYLLSQGYTFKQLHVYVDLSDIQDEAVDYILQDGRVRSRGNGVGVMDFIDFLEALSETFPLSASALVHAARPIVNRMASPEPSYLEKDFPRSAWPYNPSVKGYGPLGVAGGIENALKAMRELHALLVQEKVSLSVGVYPWPGQLRYDAKDSRHRIIWKDFCMERCEYFFDAFPGFFDLVAAQGVDRTIDDYYIAGDFHFNEAGNDVLAKSYEATVLEGSRLRGAGRASVFMAASNSL